MLGAVFTALQNPVVQGLGTALLGGHTAKQGQDQWDDAYRAPDEDAIRESYKRTQGLINQGTNFQNYSSQFLDSDAVAANSAAREAKQLGTHDGSAMLALKKRFQLSSKPHMYNAFNQNLGNMIGHQQNLDTGVRGEMQGIDAWRRQGMANRAQGNMAMGRGLMSDALKQASGWSKDDWAKGGKAIGDLFGSGGFGGLLRTGVDSAITGVNNIWEGFKG